MSSNDENLIYELLKDQCMTEVLVSSIDRSDILSLEKKTIIFEKVNNLLNSQSDALTYIVNSAIETESANDILASGTDDPYVKFIFLIAITKLLLQHSKHNNIANNLINEITLFLENNEFKSKLFENESYKKLTTQKKNVDNTTNTNQYLTYVKYGTGALVLGGLSLLAVAFTRGKK